MNIISIIKNLFIKQKLSVAPKKLALSSESIIFPEGYEQLNFCTQIPDRPIDGLSGSQFGQTILNIPATQQRDDLILQECFKGNIPGWMKEFKPITVSDGTNQLTYFVSPDVLCVGDWDDFLRVSLNAYSARRLVDTFDCMLPTKLMSDQIWQVADLKMNPTGMGASPNMTNTQTMIDHNKVIEKQRSGTNFNIIAGHKKDIIYHSALLTYKRNICIYGFHKTNGVPIQEAQYIAHVASYQDYSHSIRLISKRAILNGDTVNLIDVLNSKQYSYLISDNTFDASRIYVL